MSVSERQLLVCTCNQTIPVDVNALARGLGSAEPVTLHTQLCRKQAGAFEAAVKSGRDTVVACTQESSLFNELRTVLQVNSEIKYVNVRELAGWSVEGRQATPKIAALLAAETLPEPEPVTSVSYSSKGQLLVVGPGESALDWANRLAGQLDVSVLIADRSAGGRLPTERRYPVYSGAVKSVSGYLGAFEVAWNQVNPIDLETCTRCGACIEACPERAIDFNYQVDLDKCRSHRRCVAACGEINAIDFARAEAARCERFDLVLDLSAQPLIGLHQPPQGYFAPGPDRFQQALAALELVQMVGEFEKPRYFNYRSNICAHARSEITGCRRCIDVCSTGAIAPDGNHVKVEPHLCMGCGACASVCPSGAMSYAYPRVSDTGARIKIMLQAYRQAGGAGACLLLHNPGDGRELIAQAGRRRSPGLPANVIPVEVFHIASLGPDLMLASIACGATQFAVLSAGSEAPQYAAALREQMAFCEQVLAGLGYGDNHFRLIEAGEPGALEAALQRIGRARAPQPAGFNPGNDKRSTLEFAFEHLLKHAPTPQESIALEAGAPFGEVRVNRDTCTLCMACVGACPESALLDSKQTPALQFIERNCVQCGLCASTCPEDAIELAPRLLLTRDAKVPRVLNEAEPFNCIACGRPFGTRQMIENMLARLDSHSMFQQPGALQRLKMCADCRVVDLLKNSEHGSILDFK